jgi:hypothetical protein
VAPDLIIRGLPNKVILVAQQVIIKPLVAEVVPGQLGVTVLLLIK